MNTITISGNLVQDPKFIKGAKADFVSIRLANTYNEATVFLDALIFGKAVEFVAGARKGTPVLVSGRLTQREYTDNDGNKRTAYSVVCYEFEKLDHAKGDEKGRASGKRGYDDYEY